MGSRNYFENQPLFWSDKNKTPKFNFSHKNGLNNFLNLYHKLALEPFTIWYEPIPQKRAIYTFLYNNVVFLQTFGSSVQNTR